MIADLRTRLLQGEPLFGTLISLPSAEVVATLAAMGFDWLFLDGEHGPIEPRTLRQMLRAAGSTPCLVRTPSGDDAAVGQALDAGAAGVIIPQVHDGAQAARVAALAANRETIVVVQAESASAVQCIDAMARAPGVDAVLVGPNDLAASLGHPGAIDHPEVRAAIGRVFAACRAAARPVGIFGIDAAAARPWVEQGATLVVVGVDTVLLRQSARALLVALRE